MDFMEHVGSIALAAIPTAVILIGIWVKWAIRHSKSQEDNEENLSKDPKEWHVSHARDIARKHAKAQQTRLEKCVDQIVEQYLHKCMEIVKNKAVSSTNCNYLIQVPVDVALQGRIIGAITSRLRNLGYVVESKIHPDSSILSLLRSGITAIDRYTDFHNIEYDKTIIGSDPKLTWCILSVDWSSEITIHDDVFDGSYSKPVSGAVISPIKKASQLNGMPEEKILKILEEKVAEFAPLTAGFFVTEEMVTIATECQKKAKVFYDVDSVTSEEGTEISLV